MATPDWAFRWIKLWIFLLELELNTVLKIYSLFVERLFTAGEYGNPSNGLQNLVVKIPQIARSS